MPPSPFTSISILKLTPPPLPCHLLSPQHDGTTALVSVQVGPKLYTANAGDCRAVLCRDGRALRLSRDHKPELPEERQRIEEAGGRVANVRGTWRVVLPLADGCTAKVCSVSR